VSYVLHVRDDAGTFDDGVQRVGPFLLVHDLAVDLMYEVDAERRQLPLHSDQFIHGG
jgi:hypothetical protein